MCVRREPVADGRMTAAEQRRPCGAREKKKRKSKYRIVGFDLGRGSREGPRRLHLLYNTIYACAYEPCVRVLQTSRGSPVYGLGLSLENIRKNFERRKNSFVIPRGVDRENGLKKKRRDRNQSVRTLFRKHCRAEFNGRTTSQSVMLLLLTTTMRFPSIIKSWPAPEM